jgi:hypothetical protein
MNGRDAQHKSGVFRIPQMNRWLVVVSGEKLTDELRKAPDDTLDGLSAVEEVRKLLQPGHAEVM